MWAPTLPKHMRREMASASSHPHVLSYILSPSSMSFSASHADVHQTRGRKDVAMAARWMHHPPPLYPAPPPPTVFHPPPDDLAPFPPGYRRPPSARRGLEPPEHAPSSVYLDIRVLVVADSKLSEDKEVCFLPPFPSLLPVS